MTPHTWDERDSSKNTFPLYLLGRYDPVAWKVRFCGADTHLFQVWNRNGNERRHRFSYAQGISWHAGSVRKNGRRVEFSNIEITVEQPMEFVSYTLDCKADLLLRIINEFGRWIEVWFATPQLSDFKVVVDMANPINCEFFYHSPSGYIELDHLENERTDSQE